jgi:nitrogen regulatory protein P-II 1
VIAPCCDSFQQDFIMKQVIAIIRPYLAEKLLDHLKLAPLEALQVSEVKGFGRQKSYLDQYSSTEFSLSFLPKVEVTLWVDDLRLEEVLDTIVRSTRSGRMGDGKIMVLSTEDWAPPSR